MIYMEVRRFYMGRARMKEYPGREGLMRKHMDEE